MRNAPLIVTLLLVAGCAGNPPADSGPVQTYDVAGIVTRLPDGAGTELMVRHDAIDDFVNAEGDTIGMRSMTMGFPVADNLDLAQISAGDSVSIRFTVRWGQPRPLELIAIERR